MRTTARLAAVLCFGAIAAADCTSGGEPVHLPAQPSPTQSSTPATTPVPTVREIAVGEAINADIRGASPPCTTINGSPVECHYYALTAPATGTLTATLTWDPVASDNILVLRMEDTNFSPAASPWSPVVGKIPVVAGHRYSLEVGLAGTGEPEPSGPFVLTTAIE